MGSLTFQYPRWLIAISLTQGGALLVFMSFAGALPLIQGEWKLSNIEAGAIQSAGQFGYLLAVLLISSLADYMAPKKLIVNGVVWAGMSNLLMALFARDTTSAVFFRVLVGIGIAGVYMPGLKLISQNISPEQRGRSVGLFVAFFTLGTAVSISVGGVLSSVLGWRLAFALMSAGPAAGALISWIYLPGEREQPESNERSRSMRDLLSNRYALAVILLYLCHAWEVLGMRSWLAAYLTSVRAGGGFTLAESTRSGSLVAGMSTLVAAAATAGIGAVSDRYERITVIGVVMGLGFFFVLILGSASSLPWMVIVGLSLIASFVTNADSAVISTQLTEVVPQSYLGRTLAIYSFIGFTAGSISPLVFGVTLDYAGQLSPQTALDPWLWGFATLAAASLAGLGVAFYIKNRFES